MFMAFSFVGCSGDVNTNTDNNYQTDFDNENTDDTESYIEAPVEPSNFKAEERDSSSVYVFWDAVSDADSYIVYYRKIQNNDTYRINGSEVSIPVYSSIGTIIHDLDSYTLYIFWVRAKNKGGLSDYSSWAYCRTGKSNEGAQTTQLAKPNGLSATASGKTISVSWNPVNNITGYQLYLCTNESSDPSASYLYRSYPSTAEEVISTLQTLVVEYNTTYYIYVRTYNSTSGISYSEYAMCSVRTGSAATPNLKIVNNSSHIIGLPISFYTSTSDFLPTDYLGESGYIAKGQDFTGYVTPGIYQAILSNKRSGYRIDYNYSFVVSSEGVKTLYVTDAWFKEQQ